VVGVGRGSTSPRLRAYRHEMTCDGPSHLVLDLSRVTFFGAAGVRVLLDLREAQAADRRALCLVAAGQGRVVRVLDLLDLARLFRHYGDSGVAVAACEDLVWSRVLFRGARAGLKLRLWPM